MAPEPDGPPQRPDARQGPRRPRDGHAHHAGGPPLGGYDPRGTLTTHRATLELTLPTPRSLLRRRETPGTLTRDGRTVAELREQNGVLLAELAEPVEPLAAAFAMTVTLLRTRFEEPSTDRRVWTPKGGTPIAVDDVRGDPQDGVQYSL